jgi:hypothetical protein
MTRDDIIRMAKEAGFERTKMHGALERFAYIVATVEREACANVCENIYEGDEGCGDWPTPEMCAEAIRARGQE